MYRNVWWNVAPVVPSAPSKQLSNPDLALFNIETLLQLGPAAKMETRGTSTSSLRWSQNPLPLAKTATSPKR
eukprot:7679818-Alexandrium_andersonii.AAC.1